MPEKIDEKSIINWYPGHMLKAKNELSYHLKSIDVVLEIRDARIPISSVNHDLKGMLNQKKRILLFNKKSLADQNITNEWDLIFSNSDVPFLFIDTEDKKDITKILPLARSLMKQKWSNFYRKGISPPPLKLMVVGIPNVGKSSLINRLTKRKATKIGPNPGVTKKQFWIKLDENVELLDTPGILWPRINSHEMGLKLTITGAIKDTIVGTDKLSIYLLSILKNYKPRRLQQLYNLNISDIELSPNNLVKKIGEKRGCLKKGGIIDLKRAESLLLKDFRNGKLGRLSFDIPNK